MQPSRLSLAVVAILGLINLGRGSIHMFAPDGGLEMIAGLDISTAPQILLSFIAAVGAGQLSFALVDFAAAVRFGTFVRPLLLIHTAQQILTVFLLFVWRPLPHDVPGQWGALAALVIIGFFTALEYSRKPHVAA
ncbi:MAG: hypothetical protein SGI91_17920 [Alphaproteobacteria bacterium]|nr:hypothetical protein [Alphaproteobacteria bacterium]